MIASRTCWMHEQAAVDVGIGGEVALPLRRVPLGEPVRDLLHEVAVGIGDRATSAMCLPAVNSVRKRSFSGPEPRRICSVWISGYLARNFFRISSIPAGTDVVIEGELALLLGGDLDLGPGLRLCRGGCDHGRQGKAKSSE